MGNDMKMAMKMPRTTANFPVNMPRKISMRVE